MNSLRATVRLLGYPSRPKLRELLRERREIGQVRAKSCLRGNNESRKKAAKTYIQSGRSLQATINQLGYNVSQRTIQNWGKKFYPKARKLNNSPIKFHSKRFSWETKTKAIYAMRQPNRSVISVAREYAVSRQTLYAWDKEIPNPCIDVPELVMTPPKRDKPAPEAPSRDATMDHRVKLACNRVEFLEKQVTALVLESEHLQKQIRRLQLPRTCL